MAPSSEFSSDDTLDLTNIILLGIITVVLFFIYPYYFRPTPVNHAVPSAGRTAGGPSRDLPEKVTTHPACSRTPAHVTRHSAQMAHEGGSNLLIDGVLAFRHTTAAEVESQLDPKQVTINRKERARVLSRLMDDGLLVAPPPKGSNMVVAVPMEDVACEKLRRALYLLATYYNLMVIIAVNSSFNIKERASLVEQLRGDEILNVAVLPDHRIVASSSTAGRIAFVRQLQRIELMIDFDTEVVETLTRFGHRAMLYGNHTLPPSQDVSRLGYKLLVA